VEWPRIDGRHQRIGRLRNGGLQNGSMHSGGARKGGMQNNRHAGFLRRSPARHQEMEIRRLDTQ
jgi:hypothetical protein